MLWVSSLNMVSTYYLVSAVSCSEPKTLSMTKNNWAELEQQAAYMRVRVFWPGFDRAGEIKKEKNSQKWCDFEKVFTKSWINAKNYNGHRIQETICEGFWEVRVCSKVNDASSGNHNGKTNINGKTSNAKK